MGRLTTHVLNTAQGCPGRGVTLELWRITAESKHHLTTTTTNADGRTDQPLLSHEDLQVGSYELVFHIGQYFQAQGLDLGDRPFLDQVPIRFSIAHAEQNYHVPLVVSPWSYSTYRGS